MQELFEFTKRSLIVSIVGSLFVIPLNGQSDPLDSKDAALATLQSKSEMPALSAVVIKNGSIAYSYHSGLRRIGSPQVVSKQDRWHLGSCSKSFTALIIAQLVSEGKLEWSTKVSSYFSSVHPDLRSLTIDHLLFHHSGVLDISPSPDDDLANWNKYLNDSRPVSVQREELSQIVLRRAPRQPIGAEFSYANMNYVMLGRIIEKIEGRSWERTIAHRVLERYGIKSCGIGSATKTESPANEPFGHQLENGKLVPMPLGYDLPSWISPAGLIHCQMSDWQKFANVLLSVIKKDGSHFSKEMSDQLLKQEYPDESTLYTRMALGVAKTDKFGDMYNHVGSNGVYLSDIWIVPYANVIVLLATNSGTDAASDGIQQLANLLLEFAIQ